MTVSIANLRSSWTNVSVTYTGWGLNVNVTAYEANSKVIKVSTFTDDAANANVVFSVDPFGNIFANNINVSTITTTTLDVTTINANTISGNAANSLGIVVSETVLTTANASPYTPPANLLYAIVHVTGAGGGGGSTNGLDTAMAVGGGGGGAGGTAIRTYSYDELGTSCSFTIGIGGAGGATGGDGTSGGNTTFTPTGTTTDILTADGGIGGSGQSTTSSSGVNNGGIGGSSSNGSINLKGQAGVTGFGVTDIVVSGIGGASYYGGGARGVSRRNTSGSTSGINADTYGSGGSGGVTYNSTTSGSGGSGANGVIRIIEYKRQG